jgi:hypothetical protein
MTTFAPEIFDGPETAMAQMYANVALSVIAGTVFDP